MISNSDDNANRTGFKLSWTDEQGVEVLAECCQLVHVLNVCHCHRDVQACWKTSVIAGEGLGFIMAGCVHCMRGQTDSEPDLLCTKTAA